MRRRASSDAAVAVYRAAIRVTPDFAEAHCNLGRALRKQGNYAASLDELRTGHALGSKRSDWPYPSADWILQAERLVALGDGLAAILQGNQQPKDNVERLAVAQVYCDRNRPAAAARLRAKVLEADPKLGDDLQTGLRSRSSLRRRPGRLRGGARTSLLQAKLGRPNSGGRPSTGSSSI